MPPASKRLVYEFYAPDGFGQHPSAVADDRGARASTSGQLWQQDQVVQLFDGQRHLPLMLFTPTPFISDMCGFHDTCSCRMNAYGLCPTLSCCGGVGGAFSVPHRFSLDLTTFPHPLPWVPSQEMPSGLRLGSVHGQRK